MALVAELKEQFAAFCLQFDKYEDYIICLSKFRMKKVFIISSPSLGLETMNNRENYLQAFSHN